MGKIFSSIWILIGLVMISVFTANITLELNLEGVRYNHDIIYQTIAVLTGSHETEVSLSKGARPIGKKFFISQI